MPVEFEAKILENDPSGVTRRILSLGGRKIGESLMRRYVYDVIPGDQSKRIRLRDSGSEITLAVKEIHHC
ncbi:hypothetical protein [Staphylospora marina]|uniref:hypothetical protein n=1 Tax=Staphylospora marina TaxID=2490858 RepID=UPI0019D0D84D|nr:hypothetical protein [Staphylospora marina]